MPSGIVRKDAHVCDVENGPGATASAAAAAECHTESVEAAPGKAHTAQAGGDPEGRPHREPWV